MPRFITFLLGFGIGLAGDACHVASGTTVYDWDGVPTLWNSAIWFPFLVGLAVLGAAEVGHRLDLPSRARSRIDVVIGAAVVLALYAFTATLRDQPTTVSVVLCGAVAVAVWAWWDPSPRSLAVALVAAVLGPLAEMAVVAGGRRTTRAVLTLSVASHPGSRACTSPLVPWRAASCASAASFMALRQDVELSALLLAGASRP